ncbi:glycoside hydrolase family 43 protein [Mangrovibacterium sp.]|uniref:glycoside hydrolase family 43 protein n=1 Tax=Mangrovibacterium sp. TaxID=1961364 RepID=UPI00356932B7
MNKSNSFIVLIALLFTVTSCLQPTKTKVPSEEEMKAYLMVYFKDSDHSLHMALSADGYSFTDINKGNPVISGDTIARQKGIRDPHIMRGPDNMFYLTMTDLHIYAKQAGFRTREWERPREEYGWGNNTGFVLMKSVDLIHWSHTTVAIDKTFQGYDSIGCAWAPQTIWDDEAGKPMIYYSMRFKDGKTRLYYTYTNTAFTELETEPQLLFQYLVDSSYIDADITKIGDQFHMFYVAHDETPGIKQAVSRQVNTGYVYDPMWYDSEDVKCEAPNVWKRIGEEKWVLMYDIYGIQPHNFGFRETTDFKSFNDLGRFNEGVMKATNFEIPKHGAVIHLTKDEAEKLCEHWGLEMSFDKL